MLGDGGEFLVVLRLEKIYEEVAVVVVLIFG